MSLSERSIVKAHNSDHIGGSGRGKNEFEEDWFVGDSINSAGCGSLFPPEEQTPGLVMLEEEFYGPQQRERPWTPAGQATSENETESQCKCAMHTVRTQANFTQNHGNNYPIQRKRRQEKQAMQNKLAAAVFAHPYSLRHYCLDAYATALNLSIERQKQLAKTQETHSSGYLEDPPDIIRHYPTPPSCSVLSPSENASELRGCERFRVSCQRGNEKLSQEDIWRHVETKLGHCVTLSIFLELTESACGLSLDALLATGRIGTFSINRFFSILGETLLHISEVLSRVNPSHVFELIVNAQRSAMGKTGDVLVSGIQSVATGVGSVSNAALNRLSRQGLALAGGVVGGSRPGLSRGGMGSNGFRRVRKDPVVGDDILESKLFRRLQKMENVSKLVAYSERTGEEAFSHHAKKRAQRMMHYNVSFRPFTATIQPSSARKSNKMKQNVSFEITSIDGSFRGNDDDNGSVSSDSQNSSGSMIMRTPTSFPPTPTSRLYYFDRGSRFTENVVFLARDQLRVERGVGNHNEQTRAMSKALIDGSRLAVFDAAQAGNGIALSCGQHIATKVGNALYCSTRSMIPVMRNSYVYFEISVSPPPTMSDPSMLMPQVDTATLSVGLSTLALPLDTLVGACKESVGLCSTGQILHAGHWLSPSDVQDSCYGSNSTVGCLVYLDDNSAYDTSEGKTITADVTFNINGMIVPSSLYNGPTGDQIHPGTLRQPLSAGGHGGEPTLSMIVGKTRELFPTVTLHSPGTCVMCRFSAEDMLANTRTEIGATCGVIVYAVDGSVILDESDEDEFFDSPSPCNEFLGNSL